MKHHMPVIIITLITTIFSGCNQEHDVLERVTTNEIIIQSKDFHINSDSTELETSVRGTVFLSFQKN